MTDEAVLQNKARIAELTTTPPIVRSRRAAVLAWTKNIAVAVSFIALALGIWNSQQQNAQTRSSQTNTCIESNKVRAQAISLWQYIVDESRKANPHPTAKQAADLAAFEQRVKTTYAPRKC